MNLPEKLSREIARVTGIRASYYTLRNTPGVNVAPAMTMMAQSLERAHKAAGSGDPAEQIAAIKDLEGFTG